MTGIAQRLEADWDHITARLRRQAPETSAAPAAAAVTINTTPGGPVSQLSEFLHQAAVKFEHYDDEALAKLDAVKANPRTAQAFDLIHAVSHVDPGPFFDSAIGILQLLAGQAAQVPVQAAGPQVAGQA